MAKHNDTVKKTYSEHFYQKQSNNSYAAAKIILPLVFKQYQPKSVVDIGCGTGSWLKAAQEEGIKHIHGYDGGAISQNNLLIHKNQFTATDFTQPINPPNRFDLAISLEVAEHIEASKAKDFINTLVSFSDCILFSAAPPYQEGKHHINEQPPSYWNHLFAMHDYICFDIIRPLIWYHPGIAFHYRQNILLYIHRRKKAHFTDLGFQAVDIPYLMYHPILVQRKLQSPRFLAKHLFKQLLPTIIRKIKKKEKYHQL